MMCRRQMKTRPGEALIDCLDSIEDTKGNNGDRGGFSRSFTLPGHVLCLLGRQLTTKRCPLFCRTTAGHQPEDHLALCGPAQGQSV